jgi:hypothetical protein
MKTLTTTLVLLLSIALLSSLFLPTKTTTLLSVALATWFYFILPGYSILHYLDLKGYERVILGTAVGASLIPTVFYTLDIAGIPLSTPVIIISILLISGTALFFRKN